MPQGLQIMNAAGDVIFDTNVRAGRALGVASITAATSGSVSNAGLSTGTPFWFFQVNTTSYFTIAPTVSVSGTTLSWGAEAESNGFLVYGVY